MLLTTLVIFISCNPKQEIPVTPATALQRYLDNGDDQFAWEEVSAYKTADSVRAFDLKMTSQQWRQFTWTHQLTVLVPSKVEHDVSLLFITGGSVKDGQPNYKSHDDDLTRQLGRIAEKNKAIVAIVRQTPNQPLYDSLVEDQLISYTLHNFKNDGDFTWPLLFPMVKTAVKAMDAVQEYSRKELKQKIGKFVVSGASKRGWTTWLTGASDPRVTAIAPMVIDVLNMPVSLDYQVHVWHDYSIQIEDYVKLGIPQTVHTEGGDAISEMVDPYSYRKNLTMPKMIFIGTIDEYWPVDAIKNYLDSIPGQNFIQYVPNAGHDLGDKKQAFQALSSFFANTIATKTYPKCAWKMKDNSGDISLTAYASEDLLLEAELWSATSTDRDFRDEQWEKKVLDAHHVKEVEAQIHYPDSGYKAFYINLKYPDANGDEFLESTRMFVADSLHVLPPLQ